MRLAFAIVKKMLIIFKLCWFSETKNNISAFAWQPGLIMLKKYFTFHSLILLLITGLLSTGAEAQDSGTPSFEAYDGSPLDPSYIAGGGDSTYNQSVIKKDSVFTSKNPKRNVYKPSPVVPKEKSKDPDDDSILSFNFLYYLIQKYKMQDIVD